MFRQRLAMIFVLLSFCVYQIHARTSTVLVDFGSKPSDAPWINILNTSDGAVQNLTDSMGIPTNISLEVFDAFNGINTEGTQNPDISLGIPNTASGDSFYGNTVSFAGGAEPTGGIRLSNLDAEKEYKITVFASRNSTDNRETQYTFTGASLDTFSLNASGNTSSVVTFSGFPTAEGTIEIVASAGPNNNNSKRFYYLGALIVEHQSDVTLTPELQVIHPNGGELWQTGKNVKIQWKHVSMTANPVTVDYSIDNGANWETIGTFSSVQKSCDWLIPNTPSEQCLVRVSSDTLVDQSDNSFEISSETGSCTVVVIGSSTAVGTGASTPDSAWVNRFQNAGYLNDTRRTVFNLAMGGYTTYHLLPDENTSGSSVGISVNKQRNITKALSLNPQGIIINLPSNDAAKKIPVEDQLANFETMVNEAEAQGVRVWVCTPQPRHFGAEQVQLQEDLRDSIFAIYGDYALDFWNGLAKSNGHIHDTYNSGDGVHLNDAGHGLLYQRVMEKFDWDSFCVNTAIEKKPILIHSMVLENNYPNPFNPITEIAFQVPNPGHVHLTVYNVMGQQVKSLVNEMKSAGQHQITWDGTDMNGNHVSGGVYCYSIRYQSTSITKKMLLMK